MSEAKLPTLSEFFDQRFVRVWIDGNNLDSKTRRSYYESMKLWNLYSGNPSLSDIDDLKIADFKFALAKHRGKKPGSVLQPSSIAKHCTQLDTIFKLTGPRTRSNKLGQRLLLEPPFIDSPKVKKNPPKSVWSIDELRAMYTAADGMTKPVVEGMTTPHFWRTLIAIGWFVGLRIYELLHFSKQMIEGVWLAVANEIAKGDKGTRHYLHAEVLEHIALIDRKDGEPLLVYPKWLKSSRMLYDYLRILQASAGIAEHRRFGFHGLRKAHLTRLGTIQSPQEQALRVAQRSAGHSSIDITRDHYFSLDVHDQQTIDAINSMESPCVQTAKPQRLERIVRRAIVEVEQEWID